MIIRRKHTANFTTIGNALFNDERLMADEVGVLAYLLSKPHDWDVRRPALMNRWKLGRDSIKRIIHAGMRTGWIVACKTRLTNGTFHIVYEVRDTPGPELSDDEIKAALSVVSTGAGPDDSADDEGQDSPGSEHPPPTENQSWSAGQPGLAQPHTAETPLAKETLQKTDSQRKDSPKRARDYAELKAQWPIENVLSETASSKAFLDLTDVQKAEAIDRAGAYLADCKAQTRKVCDLTTFIRERRWERFKAKAKTNLVSIKFGSPQWFRWRDYTIATRGDLAKFDSMGKTYGGIARETEWPPGDHLAKTG